MPEYVPPEMAHGPGIRKAMRSLGEDIQKESGAKRVIITCTYDLNGTSDKMKIRMQVSTDNVMERTDAHPPKPKGDKLTMDAEQSVRQILDVRPEDGGKSNGRQE